MRLLVRTVLLMMLVFALASGAYAEETYHGEANPFCEEKTEEVSPFSADANIGVYSHYMWRGQRLSNKGVVQPDLTFSYYGFAVNYWSNYDSDTNKVIETDYTVSYSHGFDKLGLEIGQIYYELDGAEDTQEFYLSAGYDILLQPNFTWYYDFREGRGSYLELNLGHSFSLPYDIGLDLGATASYMIDNVIMGTERDGSDLDCFYHGEVSASATIPIWRAIYASPMMAVSFALDDDSRRIFRNIIQSNDFGGGSTVFYGGLAIGYSM